MQSFDKFDDISSVLGLSKWTTLGNSELHLSLLEYLNASSSNEQIPVKRITSLIQHVENAIKNEEDSIVKQNALDRLGQFLHGISAKGQIVGKTLEIIDVLSKLPGNRLIGMYVMNLANFK